MRNLIFILLVALAACGTKQYSSPHVRISTTMGDIELELYPDKAPKTVAAFLSYVDSGWYTNSSFYRVLMQEGYSPSSNTGLIQGGIWLTNDKQHPAVPGVPHESTQRSGLSHTSGTVSLARTKPGTGNTEFFICIGDQLQFNHGNGDDGEGFAAFGRVTEGMDVARSIQAAPHNGESFAPKITITSIKRL